ncbi:MAG: hypothetical protein DRI69_08695 [Bacteroidetes bacterium]|nr:MAG: hypothetical protein DRI69_08695 [Bacteroidota bacterium]
MSRCEITYRTETQSLEIVQHMYVDDLELALKQDFDGPIHLCTELEIDSAEVMVQKYVSQHFALTTESGQIDVTFLGKEVGDEPLGMWVYIEATDVTLSPELTISYDLLCEIFDDQKNIVSFQIDNNKKQMFLLDHNTPKIKIETGR